MCAFQIKNLRIQNNRTSITPLSIFSSRVRHSKSMQLPVLPLLFLLVSMLHCSLAQTCDADGPCRCKMSDGSGTIDISSLGNQDGTARFSDVVDPFGQAFAINPCFDFTLDGCKDVSVCKKPTLIGSVYENYGNSKDAVWSYNGFNAMLTLRGDNNHQSEFMLLCQPTEENAMVDAIGEITYGTPTFLISSKCACPGACESVFPQDGDTGGLTAGSILLIICFVLILVYLVGGITFNRVKRQATGVEMMPHPEFWMGLPGLIKDGMVFFWGLITGKSSKSGYESV